MVDLHIAADKGFLQQVILRHIDDLAERQPGQHPVDRVGAVAGGIEPLDHELVQLHGVVAVGVVLGDPG